MIEPEDSDNENEDSDNNEEEGHEKRRILFVKYFQESLLMTPSQVEKTYYSAGIYPDVCITNYAKIIQIKVTATAAKLIATLHKPWSLKSYIESAKPITLTAGVIIDFTTTTVDGGTYVT